MRQIKVLGLCLVAVFALAAVTASGASAATPKPLLQFENEGSPVPSGAPANLFLTIGGNSPGGCIIVAQGTLGTNPAKSVVDKTSGPVFFESCDPNVSFSGGPEEITWGTNGKLKVKAKVELTYSGTPGPCVYAFTKFKPPAFAIPGESQFEGTSKGKLNKALSFKPAKKEAGCEKTLELPYSGGAVNEEFGTFAISLT